MIHLVTQASIDIPIIFVDTGYLFPATYDYAAILQEKLNFKVKTFSANMSPAFQKLPLANCGKRGKRGCLSIHINKKEPMDRALQENGSTIWLAGLRKSQANPDLIYLYREQNGIYKLYPILDWTDKETYQYCLKTIFPIIHSKEWGMNHWEIGIVPRKFRKFKIKKRHGMGPRSGVRIAY